MAWGGAVCTWAVAELTGDAWGDGAWGDIAWGEVAWGATAWGGVTWGDGARGAIAWGEGVWGDGALTGEVAVAWDEVACGEVAWGDVAWAVEEFTAGFAALTPPAGRGVEAGRGVDAGRGVEALPKEENSGRSTPCGAGFVLVDAGLVCADAGLAPGADSSAFVGLGLGLGLGLAVLALGAEVPTGLEARGVGGAPKEENIWRTFSCCAGLALADAGRELSEKACVLVVGALRTRGTPMSPAESMTVRLIGRAL